MYLNGTLEFTIMLVISSREFRDNQASYFDRVDNGEEVLVQRGKNKSYKIVPISESDTIISKEYILQPDEDYAKAIGLDELLIGVKEDISEMFKKGKK